MTENKNESIFVTFAVLSLYSGFGSDRMKKKTLFFNSSMIFGHKRKKCKFISLTCSCFVPYLIQKYRGVTKMSINYVICCTFWTNFAINFKYEKKFFGDFSLIYCLFSLVKVVKERNCVTNCCRKFLGRKLLISSFRKVKFDKNPNSLQIFKNFF